MSSDYICVGNFKDGKKEGSGEGLHFKIGQSYTGSNVEKFLSLGLIKPNEEILKQQHESLKKLAEQRTAEAHAAGEKLKTVLDEKQAKSSSSKKGK